ncbi:MAG: hypothetical protein ACREEM_00980 [Blastocatellia bacterium]
MRLGLPLILIGLSFHHALAQTPQRETRARTASVSGRVTIAGKPAANAMVTIEEFTRGSGDAKILPGGIVQPRIFAKVRTGGDGRYRITGLAEGHYRIRALSNAYVSKRVDRGEEGQITLDDGEAREDVNFEFVLGGVVTGRVTDAEGRPLIASGIQLIALNEKGEPKENSDFNFADAMMETDDRGVYRLYGLPAGRYLVGAGGERWVQRANGSLPTTYHPDTIDQKQAKAVEVKEGETVENIDIRFGVARKTYEALGRVVDAETGQPIPRLQLVCYEFKEKEQIDYETQRSAVTDEQGRFKMLGLATGQYDLKAQGYRGEVVEHFIENAVFAVNDADVSGLEIRAMRGGSVSGTLTVAGAADPSVKSRLAQTILLIHLFRERDPAIADGPAYQQPGGGTAKVNSDGSFRLSGLPPGRLMFDLYYAERNLLTINRIERDGAPIMQALELKRGEQIGNLRIVMDYANGAIRGQVQIAGGALPPGWRLQVSAGRVRQTKESNELPVFVSGVQSDQVDEKGRFLFEHLAPGNYELTVSAHIRNIANGGALPAQVEESKQRVTVGNGAEVTVTIPFDPKRQKR